MTVDETARQAEQGRASAPAQAGAAEVDILWISEGMSCDGNTVSITASSQPSIEDVVLGLIPGLPKVNLYNKVLSPSLGGEDFLAPYRAAARGESPNPFVLVIEGSIPNENINGEGYWTSFGNDQATGEPLTLNWWIDQLAPGPGPWSPSAPARPTAVSTPWPATRQAPWGWATTSARTTARPGSSRSSTSPAARCSRRTSWRA